MGLLLLLRASSSSLPSPSPPRTPPSPSTGAHARPSVILPGLGNNSGDYHRLASTLRRSYGIPTVVAKVTRVDWLRNAAGLLDTDYWRGTLRPRPVLDWYLDRMGEAIAEAKQLQQQDDHRPGVSLIGHSAGGWLARIYMEEFDSSDVSLLLTLGSPHLPPPKGLPGVIDQTRGLLDYVERYCTPAVNTPELRYVCVAGRYIQGARMTGKSTDPRAVESSNPKIPTTKTPISTGGVSNVRARVVGQGYKQVCGRADVWGDGVVPEESAHLQGADNVTLDGVYHSPVGSDDERTLWYGSPPVLEKWVHHLLQ